MPKKQAAELLICEALAAYQLSCQVLGTEIQKKKLQQTRNRITHTHTDTKALEYTVEGASTAGIGSAKRESVHSIIEAQQATFRAHLLLILKNRQLLPPAEDRGFGTLGLPSETTTRSGPSQKPGWRTSPHVMTGS